MADTNRIELHTFTDGDEPYESGAPEKILPILRSQNQGDTPKVAQIRIIPADPATTIVYETGGFPLALDDSNDPITPDEDTPWHHYKFSAFLAEQLGLSNYLTDPPAIMSVEASGRIKIGSDYHYAFYDRIKDKLRLFDVNTGVEASEDDVVVNEDDDDELQLTVVYI